MPLQATSGAASYDAFGGGVAAVPNYIEDVFSTWLYTGNDTSTTINNGIDLAGKGGLVWVKPRNTSTYNNHILVDTVRGANERLFLPPIIAQDFSASINTFSSTGFRVDGVDTNNSTQNYVSWTFRKKSKFFDVVTWSGNDASNRQIAHNLGSVPGCIIARAYTSDSDWAVYHRSLGNTKGMYLNLTQAQETNTTWGNTTPTSSVFTTNLNGAGNNYIAYLFAHDAGGFGLTGTDNVISCGTFTASAGETATVTLGYEPQFLLFKPSSTTGDWQIVDTMRPWAVAADAFSLKPNTTAAEANFGAIKPSATGFYATSNLTANATYIYIAIRRGPMKVPTSGTSVFALGGTSSSTLTTSFAVDAFIQNSLSSSASNSRFCSRLQGSNRRLVTSSTAAEAADSGDSQFDGASYTVGGAGSGIVFGFGRAPSFFDEVCYTGTGATQNVAHNLGVIPSFIVCKRRNGVANWCALAGKSNGTYESLYLNTTVGTLYTAPSAAVAGLTATTFDPQAVFPSEVNGSGETYVAYLFGTVAGVSKVGSYTGTGTTKQIDCGFTGGARFVLIKKTSGTGSWYVWDSARGIVSGNDPYLLLNSTAAEVTNTDYIDTYSAGFEISSTAPADINASGGTFVFLAIA